MKTTIEIELPELPEAKKGHKWEIRGLGWERKKPSVFAVLWLNDKYRSWDVFPEDAISNINPLCIYAELVRTHREDGTPLDIPELPKMPDNVERVEYFGIGMKPDDMGDADNYICIKINDGHWDLAGTKTTWINKDPVGLNNYHYARIWYKKEKPAPTELSDLIGEDGQKIAYLIKRNGDVKIFRPNIENNIWDEHGISRDGLIKYYRWSNSPFTKYEDANPFIF